MGMESEAKPYVIHTYSGYEKKVKATIEKTVAAGNLQDQILEVILPTEEVVEVKNGEKKVGEVKKTPSYLVVRMVMNPKTWYIVRNTRGVTGFLGTNPADPTPLSEEDLQRLGMGSKANIVVDYEVGDEVVATNGAWRDTVGKIKAINQQKQTVTIMVEMFGRETPVELGFTEVKKKA